jgi:hypothetical protein
VNRNQLCAKNGLRIESDELKKSVERWENKIEVVFWKI